MASERSKMRRNKNEELFRAENERIQNMAEGLLDSAGAHFMPISFTCECSDANCNQKIELPLEDFKVAHQYDDRYIIVPGHEQKDIEKVIDRAGNFVIVEKLVNGS